ncbi:MAG: type II secretion system F family protein [Candidatus Xenobium sp.]|jgi:type II secretory pathway component PulF|nr:hypothetical protein [Burkholderiales bacterium]
MKRVGYPILWSAFLLFLIGLLLSILGVVMMVLEGVLGEVSILIGLFFWKVGGLFCWAGVLAPFLYDWFRGRTPAEDRALLAETLADLLELGLPLDQALARLGAEMRSNAAYSRSRTAFAAVEAARGLAGGATLAEALTTTGAFPDRWSRLVAAGEATEQLPEALRSLARLERVQGPLPFEALVRTFIFLPMAGGILLILGAYALPSLTLPLEAMGLGLPATTRILILGSHILPLLLGILVLCIPLALLAALWRPLREAMSNLASRLGTGNRQAQGLVLGALAAATRLEMSLDEMLQVASQTTTDPRYRRALQAGSGDTLAEVLEARPDLFEPQVRWLVRQAERDGNLAQVLEHCATYLQEVAEQTRWRRRVLTEVGLTAAMGVVALLMMLGVMMPLTRLTTEALLR